MRALISGAGIAGLSLAQRLHSLGWDVVVVEKSAAPRDQGYMIDFFGPGYDAVEAMGVLPRLRELSYDVEEMTYLDESGRRRAGLDYGRFARMVDGRLLTIMRPDLELALRERVAGDVDLRYGRGIERIEQADGVVHARLTDGTELDVDLLVGADGIHSTVRRLVFGEEARYFRYLGLHTAAYIIDDPEIFRQVNGRFCLSDTVGRQVGFYGLRDGRVAVFTVHRTPDPALPGDPRQAVRDAYATLGWLAPRALEKCPEPAEMYYDQVAQIEIPRWSNGRVVLLGDACQAVSLLAGQGASLAIAAAYILAAQLDTAGSVEEALAGYQRLWQPTIADKQRSARRGAEWFLPSSAVRLPFRRFAMRLVNVPGLDRYFGSALLGKATALVKEAGAAQAHQRAGG